MHLPRRLYDVIVAHAVSTLPEEACGLLAFDSDDRLRDAYCIANTECSPVRFTVDPDGNFAALRNAEAQGWRLGGAFHSHPRGAAIPSSTDIAGALDSEWIHLIFGLGSDRSEVRGWRIRHGAVTEEGVEVVEESDTPWV